MRVIPLRFDREPAAQELFKTLGVSKEGIAILGPKSVYAAFRIDGLSAWEANIIKQDLLSLGADAALNRDVLIKEMKTSIAVFGSIAQLKRLCVKLKHQPFGLKEFSIQLTVALKNCFSDKLAFNARGKRLNFSVPIICGIINVTEDSFYGDGILRNSSMQTVDAAVKKAEKMIKNGAVILDVGAESSRPGSRPLKEKDEVVRLRPVIKGLRKEFKNVLISVDTYKYAVVQMVADCGADIINDITALRYAPKITGVIKRYKLGCILMHMQGIPATMQVKPVYKCVTSELHDFFLERLVFCEKNGINKSSLMIDPGIGFGKTPAHNLEILKNIFQFKVFGCPVFLGLSRKSFVGKTLKVKINDRLPGTLGASVYAMLQGANIFRTHDVKETREALTMAARIRNYD
jgi:dihydropteroate synthase